MFNFQANPVKTNATSWNTMSMSMPRTKPTGRLWHNTADSQQNYQQGLQIQKNRVAWNGAMLQPNNFITNHFNFSTTTFILIHRYIIPPDTYSTHKFFSQLKFLLVIYNPVSPASPIYQRDTPSCFRSL